MQADKHHILGAVLTCQPSAQGGRYLQRTLPKELQNQIKQHEGDVKGALPAALSALNKAYRDLHPFNGPVLENVKIAIAYADLRSQVRGVPVAKVAAGHHVGSSVGCSMTQERTVLSWSLCFETCCWALQVLHTASNGACRVVVGRTLSDGGVHTVADVGRSSSSASPDEAEAGSSTAEQQDEALRDMHFATVKLRAGIDTVIIGSEGLW